MKIDIPKWAEYNPRNDAKAWSWFRLQNDFLADPVVYELPGWQKLLLLFLFAERNKSGKPFEISHKQAADHCDCTREQIQEGLRVLAEKGKIQLIDIERSRTDDVRPRTGAESETNVDVRERTDDERERTDDEAIRSLRDETRRNETTTPLTPRHGRGDERKRRRWAKDRATALVTRVIGAARNGLNEDDAQRFVGDEGWILLKAKFRSWEGFDRAYETATTRNRSGVSQATAFESQLRDSFRVLLLEAPPEWTGEGDDAPAAEHHS